MEKLAKINDVSIKESAQKYSVRAKVNIFCKTIWKENVSGKTAIFIHGGGSGGDHSLCVRPAKHMIQAGLYSKVLTPDRRGAGQSSLLEKKPTFKDNAEDMKALLDSMGIHEKVTAIGISYGGPVALTLAAIDSRVDEVVLLASSPSLDPKGITKLTYKLGFLEPMIKSFYKKNLGKLEPKNIDFDASYDVESQKELTTLFTESIKHTPAEKLDSLIYENAATLDLENGSIDRSIQLDIPIYQIIGDRDTTWEINMVENYKDRFPNCKVKILPGFNHKDVFTKAHDYYAEVITFLQQYAKVSV
ncbi:alpha/beta hydrolase [Bacillus sp. HMF5848]|uniref:alpha/beta fold hydrolase n=1 Tax=Bacillus sp. HMF5848 TaxID=2495421 RepID=UPI000F7796C0|nr:alpha/beta hydrolase [Bacillus sp. HMF5848]RSK25860.1 alpha/beta hydrolase [Bacillus sp. HMF5848]